MFLTNMNYTMKHTKMPYEEDREKNTSILDTYMSLTKLNDKAQFQYIGVNFIDNHF